MVETKLFLSYFVLSFVITIFHFLYSDILSWMFQGGGVGKALRSFITYVSCIINGYVDGFPYEGKREGEPDKTVLGGGCLARLEKERGKGLW